MVMSIPHIHRPAMLDQVLIFEFILAHVYQPSVFALFMGFSGEIKDHLASEPRSYATGLDLLHTGRFQRWLGAYDNAMASVEDAQAVDSLKCAELAIAPHRQTPRGHKPPRTLQVRIRAVQEWAATDAAMEVCACNVVRVTNEMGDASELLPRYASMTTVGCAIIDLKACIA